MTDARRLPRGHRAAPSPPSRRDPTRARDLIQKLRGSRYSPPEWALFTEVRSRTGALSSMVGADVLRVADAIAVKTLGPDDRLVLHGFECKVSRADWLRELADPLKCAPFKLFCDCWYLVVPAPWKKVVLCLSELPEGWGLLEAGTDDPIVEAIPREAEPPTPAFLRALCRVASTAQASADQGAAGAAPLMPIARRVSREEVVLGCGHSLLHPPLVKASSGTPLVPCVSCALHLPADLELALAAIREAGPAELAQIAAAVRERRSA